jgi:aspartyl-tRNA(Asn)/glutamyl-tRNA(Gln) amidotransferase subunit A
MKTANKTVTATQLVKDALKKAEFFKDYNVFISLNEEAALKRAAGIDERIARGENVGRLAGVPFAAKDNYLVKGTKTTAASHILEPFEAPLNATIIDQLEAEGAIMIGKVNLDSFAHGSSTENSYFGPTLNAVDKTRVAGGSSGGSAVAVALDVVEFTTGSDTGGSIRQPASFNGVYGLKPTYGATSRYGVVSMASSLDTDGFFTKSAEDLDLLMSICAHRDEKDLTTLPDFYETSEAKKVQKIGVIKEFDSDVVDPEIRACLKEKCEELKKSGHEIIEIEMPTLKYALAVYYIIQPAEVASNLSRYDGIRYGFRSENSADLDSLYGNTRNEGFMKENKRRIMIGNFVLSSGFYDAYFLKAAKARTLIINEYDKAFEKCDVLLTPVSPNPAFKLGEKVDDPIAMYIEDLMSVSINLAGIPGIAIPAGKTKSGLPIGLQILGPRRSDKTIINFAKELA